jgi:hypothetical protein
MRTFRAARNACGMMSAGRGNAIDALRSDAVADVDEHGR